jgi:hypothetical protein
VLYDRRAHRKGTTMPRPAAPGILDCPRLLHLCARLSMARHPSLRTSPSSSCCPSACLPSPSTHSRSRPYTVRRIPAVAVELQQAPCFVHLCVRPLE